MKIKINIITPVIISNGEKVSNNYDFFIEEKNKEKFINFINFDYLLNLIGENYKDTKVIEEIVNNFNIKEIIDKYLGEISNEEKKKLIINSLKIPADFKVNEIEKQMRTGLGNPIIPGSSIKGYLRNVIKYEIYNKSKNYYDRLLSLVRNKDKENKPEKNPDKSILSKIFGEEPIYNIMRSIIVCDAMFDKNDIEVHRIVVMSLDKDNKYGFKKVIKVSGNLTGRVDEAEKIYSEMIKEGASAEFKIKNIEKFKEIFEIIMALTKDKFLAEKIAKMDVKTLFERINNYARTLIKSEISFFEKCKYQEQKIFYENLLKRIPSDNKKAIIQISKHTGWKNKTGNWIDESRLVSSCTNTNTNTKINNSSNETILASIRKKFYLGKKDFAIFPKTRKLVHCKDSYKPLGWCELEIV